MVVSKTGGKQVIRHNDCSVNIKDFYTKVKEKIEDLDFDFVEKEQEQNTKQYGGFRLLKFEGSKEVNEFVKKTMKITLRFEKIKRGKCDVKINTHFVVHYDYKNRWDTNELKKFLLHVFLTFLVRNKLKTTYFVPVILEHSKFVKFLKKSLNMYDK